MRLEKYLLNEYQRKEKVEKVIKIFVDMDGVLVDFEKRAKQLFSKNWKKIYINDPTLFWKTITNKGTKFWSEMKWISGGKKLWDFIKEYNPVILSAHPRESHMSEQGKKIWLKKYLGKRFAKSAIICLKAEKANYAKSGYILIDDNKNIIEKWRKAGGIGILHKNTAETIKKMKELGIT